MKQQKKTLKMKKYSFLITFFIGLCCFSQNYKGAIKTIEKDGLHKIMLTPELRSASNEDFGYVRLKDSNNQEAPYVLIYNTDEKFSSFNPLEIASKIAIKDSITSIEIENKTGKNQERITLRIANTKVLKRYSIFGSDNGVDWFGLISNKRMSYKNLPKQTFLEKTIHFPLNAYKFLRIDFNDKKSLPINILEAGVYESRFFTQSPIEIKEYQEEVISVNEKKRTQIKFVAPTSQKINTISFDIDTQYFLRKANILVEKTRKIKKRIETYNEVVARFELNSKNKNTFELSNLSAKEFTLEIENQDNPPLKIDNIQLFQKPIYLIANLKEKERYEIVIDTSLTRPSYDLGNFISNKIKSIEEAKITDFYKIEKKDDVLKAKSFWQTSAFMWICIVLGGLLVVYFALSLLKDIGNESNNSK